MTTPFIKLITKNKKAYHDYAIQDTLEVGIVLKGAEVKSIRDNNVQLTGTYVMIDRAELYLIGCHIAPYEHINTIEYVDPIRTRKLLAHKKQIIKLTSGMDQDGSTIVPLKLYFKGSHVKLEIGIVKAKKLYDKRETLKKRAIQRDLDRAVRR